ncbi:Hsp90 cochaperone [Ascosphaera acerosa]|nr:Hsp90 cochaperone [Ascosphaera acerosa]
MADALKAEGNKAFAAKDFDLAVEKFTQAIALDPSNHVLYSNRSGAYASLRDFQKALDDASKVTEIKPDWPKGWGRKGAAMHGMGDLVGASDAYEHALSLDPANAQAKAGLDAVQRAMQAESAGGAPTDFLNMFKDPQLLQKLAANPKTAALLADQAFVAKLMALKDSPNAMQEALQDPRFLQVMGVLMGIDMQFAERPEEAAAGATPQQQETEEDVKMTTAEEEKKKTEEKSETKTPAEHAAATATATATTTTEEPATEEESAEAAAAAAAKAAADTEKTLGTACYKKRDFPNAIAHYTKAWELHKDITYLTNLGAARFEAGDYEGCIEACTTAVAEGRELRADFKVVAKAFGRIGSAHERLGNLPAAIEFYTKSLTEHRTPDVLAKLRAAEKAKAAAEKAAYVSPEEAEKARARGNEHFKAGDYPAAVDAYTEWTKRAPDDARAFSNRAAALIKLLAMPQAIADCDEALKRDPKFIRAYLRKAQALFAMKEFSRCVDVCTEATEVDVDAGGPNAREIDAQMQKALEAMYAARAGETEQETAERIQRDPEIMGILQDPVMQSILGQAKENPAALVEHMQNPQVRTKVQKLMAAGVIRTR